MQERGQKICDRILQNGKDILYTDMIEYEHHPSVLLDADWNVDEIKTEEDKSDEKL
ncbi:MAG: hypothetical protein LKG91_05075 [Eubacterium sp.]|jgi:hypothetical protein|nr:hypothetical protein [Eubacterium sp.]